MKISKEELGRTSKGLIDFLDENNLNSVRDIEKLLGRRFVVNKKLDYVNIELRPSNFGTSAHTISYIVPYLQGIPLEIKINQVLSYSQLIIKAYEEIDGYMPFSTDIFDNIIQARRIEGADMNSIRSELKNICGL